MNVWKILAPPALLLAGHSATVALHHQKKLDDVNSSMALAKEFRPGRVDDVMMDNMQTGDVVMFRRIWYYNYFPAAISILLYRKITGCDFDHLGVVVLDKLGTAWLIERTPFHKGAVCSRLADRLKLSEAEIITMVPILPRPTNPRTFSNVAGIANAVTISEEKDNSSEMVGLLKFSLRAMWEDLFAKSCQRLNEKANICPNIRLCSEALSQLGIELQFERDGDISLEVIENRQVSVRKKGDGVTTIKGNIKFAPDDVLLRTR